MFPDIDQRFLNIWPDFSKNLIDNCKNITKSPSLLKFIGNDLGCYILLQY